MGKAWNAKRAAKKKIRKFYSGGNKVVAATKGRRGIKKPTGWKPVTQEQFVSLQNKWYDKIKNTPDANGEKFSDIEWYDKKTGLGQNSDYLKNSNMGSANISTNLEKQQYHRLLQNFCTHVKGLSDREMFILEHMVQGLTYRAIVVLFAKKFGKRVSRGSLYSIFMTGKELEKQCYEFNKTDKEGLLNPVQTNGDFFVDEILLSEPVQVYHETVAEHEQIILGDLRKWSM